MYKKLLISSIILVVSIFSVSMCFADNEMKNATDDVRNVVGGAENAIENGVKDISNTSMTLKKI